MKEERISPRVLIELPAKFCFEDKPNSWEKATVTNISTHGFCFRVKAKYNDVFQRNQVIQLDIQVLKKESVRLDIKIAWAGRTSSVNCLVGGEILNPSGDDYQKILKFYNELL